MDVTHRPLRPLLSLAALLAAAVATFPVASSRPLPASLDAAQPPSDASAVQWNYTPGPKGPDHWGTLHPSFWRCGKGKQQSPIDIPKETQWMARTRNVTIGSVVSLPRTVVLEPHNGRINMATTCATFGTCGSLQWRGRKYFFTNLHFHETSEHRLRGETMDMEAHLVMSTHEAQHKAHAWEDEHPHLAVVAVFLQVGQANAVLDEVLDGLEAGNYVPVGDLWYNLLVPKSGFCSWRGSLTTPPCTEDVEWLVQSQVVHASPRQLKRFANDIHVGVQGVNRPVQPVNNRDIKCYEA